MSFSITVVSRVVHLHFFVQGLINVFPHLTAGYMVAGTMLGFASRHIPSPSTMPGMLEALGKCWLNEGMLNGE